MSLVRAFDCCVGGETCLLPNSMVHVVGQHDFLLYFVGVCNQDSMCDSNREVLSNLCLFLIGVVRQLHAVDYHCRLYVVQVCGWRI